MSEKEESEQVEEYQEGELLRLEDLCLIKGERIAVADHANGILIFQLGGADGGKLIKHLNSDKDTLAFSVKYSSATDELYALILDVPGWILNVYDEKTDFALVKQIVAPTQPEVARMKLRWLTVTKAGDVYVLAAGNVWSLKKSDSTWTLVHNDQSKQAWYSHLTPAGDSEPGSFVVCWQGSTLRRVKISNDEGFVIEKTDVGAPEIKEMGAFTVDDHGNLIISDWSTGEIVLCDANDKAKRKLLGSVGEGEAYVMAAGDHKVYVGCKTSLQVRVFNY